MSQRLFDSAIVRDVAGNVNTTATNYVEVDNYLGAGGIAFQGDSLLENQIFLLRNGFLQLTAGTSVYGIV